MKNIFTIGFALLSTCLVAQNGAPAAPYYNGFNFNQTGATLKSALSNKVTTTHTNPLTYQEAEFAIKIVDIDPNGNGIDLLLLYGFSDTKCPESAIDDKDHRTRHVTFEDDGSASSCLWNREHTFPKALGVPNLGQTGPGADAHHLRACDKKRNADRDNDKFYDDSGNSHENGILWYPGDEWKGDVARMVMYMYVRYGNQCMPKNVGVGNIIASDTSMIDLFLKWNAEDPVSQYEDNRNNYLGNRSNTWAQGNRNPFIDNPYLATVIWGGIPAENRWPTILSTANADLNTAIAVFPNPSVDQKININTAVELDEIQLINLNGQLIQVIKNPVQIQNQYTLENIPAGFYLLKMNANNQSITKKVIIN